jgi:tetratricopeptide (TPR) repeat protein
MNFFSRRDFPWKVCFLALVTLVILCCAGREKAREKALEKVELGETLLKAGNYKQAEAYFREATELDPELPEAYQGLGIALCRSDQVEPGLDALNHALRLNPADSKTLMAKGICEEHQAEAGLEHAIASYRKALILDPANPVLRNQLGVAFQKLGDHRRAVQEFQNAIDMEPRLFVAYNNLGTSLAMLGEYDQAIRLYQEAIKRHPDLTGLYFYTNLGIAFLYKNNLERAESAFLMETALNPEHLEAHLNLGNIYTIKGYYDKAIIEYSRVLALNPEHRPALINLAIVYLVKEKPLEARKHLDLLLSLEPEHAAGHYYLGKSYSLLGDKEKALQEYEKALSLGFKPPSSPSQDR